jgi:hypothetical protein
MDDNNAIDIAESGFSDFEAAFNEEDGYQTEETGNEAQEETTEAETEEAQDDTGEETPTEEGAESGGEQESSAQPTEDKPQETFTIRVNKEDRNVSREEMISLAQKGADYDRTKGQLTEARQTIQTLQQQVGESQAVMEVLQMISEESKMPIDQIVEQFHLNLRMKNGETEAEAKANIRAIKAERQVSAIRKQEADTKAQQVDNKTRAEKDIADFRKKYPDVELTETLCNALMADVQGGMPLAEAYQKHVMAQKDAEIAELKRKMAAAEQNSKNRAKSPGSQKDSGGQRSKNAEDDFFAAFER